MKKLILLFTLLMVIFFSSGFNVSATPVKPGTTYQPPFKESTDPISSPIGTDSSVNIQTPSKEGYHELLKVIIFPKELTSQQKYDWVNAYPALYPKLIQNEQEEYKKLYPSEYYNKVYAIGIDSVDTDTTSATKFPRDLINSSNLMWLMIPVALQSGQSPMQPGYFDIMTVANMPAIQAIFKTFAYTLCLLFIGINMISTTFRYEIFTYKGGAKILGQILLAKIWVDLSYKVCEWILAINNEIVNKIVKVSLSMTFFNGDFLPKPKKSSVPVIGPIIDFFNAIFNSFPMSIMAFIVTVAACIIIIKLMLRSIELAAMVAISPPFFACIAGGDSTIRYFKNFLNAFISLTVETIYMSIVYFVGSMWFKDVAANADNAFIQLLPNCLVIIGIAILIVKPPRMLRNLVS